MLINAIEITGKINAAIRKHFTVLELGAIEVFERKGTPGPEASFEGDKWRIGILRGRLNRTLDFEPHG